MATTQSKRKNTTGCIETYNDLSRTEREAIERRAGRAAPGAGFVGIDVDGNLHYFSKLEETAVTFSSVGDLEPTLHDLGQLPIAPKHRTPVTWVEMISQKHGGRGWLQVMMRPAIQDAHEVNK